MDLLRLLETTARQIALQKDKNEGIKQQEANLRQELAAAQAEQAMKRSTLAHEQQQHFSMTSDMQQQENAIAESQATNTALKATITDTQHERAQVMEQLRQLQDEFIQASSTLDADVRALSSQAHGALSGDSTLLTYLQFTSSAAVQNFATAAAAGEADHAAEQQDAEVLDAGNDVAAV